MSATLLMHGKSLDQANSLPDQIQPPWEASCLMTSADLKYPSTPTALIRGVVGRCPRCGRGRLLHRYLKMTERCAVCGEPYGHFRIDDAASWLTILVVGHITVPIILLCELSFQLSLWLAYTIYLPLVVGLAAIMLPRCKGAIAALMWAMKAGRLRNDLRAAWAMARS